MIWKTILLLVAVLVSSGTGAGATRIWVPRFGEPVLVSDNLVFAEPGREPHRLICIKKESGRKLWEITDSKNAIRPCFVLGNQLIVTTGETIQCCESEAGNLSLVYRSPFERIDTLENLRDGSLLVQGHRKNLDYLARLETGSWHVAWERPRITGVIAIGQDVLLCDEASRKPSEGGSYTLSDERWVALSKRDGKLMWSSQPFANAAAVRNYFLLYLKDTISCYNQGDGALVKQIAIQQEPYAQASLAANDQRLFVRTRQAQSNNPSGPNAFFFSLSVPELRWHDLSEGEWNNVLEAQSGVRDDNYAYSAAIAPGWQKTSIDRTEIRTGKREELYQEPVPVAFRPNGVTR